MTIREVYGPFSQFERTLNKARLFSLSCGIRTGCGHYIFADSDFYASVWTFFHTTKVAVNDTKPTRGNTLMTEVKKIERLADDAKHVAEQYAPLAMKDVIAAALMMKRSANDKTAGAKKAA